MTVRKNRRGIQPRHAVELSFMAPRSIGGGVDHFRAETTGSYSGDCDHGRALAMEYLDYVGKHPTNGNTTLLACIVLDMMKADTSKGLIIGFMGAVNEYAMSVARLLSDEALASNQAASPSE